MQHDHEKGSSIGDKAEFHNVEEVALEGHTATDKYGHALVELDRKAEAALQRKMDFRLLPMVFLLYLFCFIDRANIGNARLAGLEKDLKLTGKYDYNILLTAFYVAYVVFEPPMNWICKKMTPGKFIPILCFGFGLFSLAMAFVHSFGAGIAVRFLLGVAEAGVFPGFAFYLSRWYRKDELAFRMSIFILGAPLAGAFGGLLASGLLKAPSFGMVHTWRMIFFAEGIMTMGIAIISWFILTDRPEVARWLNDEEKALAAARIKSENVGQLTVVDAAKTKVYLSGMFNTNSLVIALIFLLDNITVQGLGFFLPTIVKTIFPRKTTIQLQLQTVPPYIVGAAVSVLLPFLSWKTKKRALWMSISAPLMIVGYAMFVASTNPHVRYGACFLIAAGAFSFGSFCNSWSAINTTSDTARAGAIAVTVFGGNIGGLIATWSYLSKYAPNQIPGNSLNLATSSSILLLTLGLWAWQKRENKLRDEGRMDHVLEGRTEEEIAMLGQKHPGFRYRH